MYNIHRYIDETKILGKRKVENVNDFNVQIKRHNYNHSNIINEIVSCSNHLNEEKNSGSHFKSNAQEFHSKNSAQVTEHENRVLQVFQILELQLFDFLIDHETPANFSTDLCNLMSCNKFINNTLIDLFMGKSIFQFKHLLHCAKTILERIMLARTVIVGENEISFILKMTPKIESLTLVDCKTFNYDEFPTTLTELNIISSSLTITDLKYDFPINLSVLTLPDNYNDKPSINSLPRTLTKLQFGNSFNQVIDPGVLPDGLETLIFGNDFNKEIICGVLPSTLTYLSFGEKFIKPFIVGVLPNSLSTMRLPQIHPDQEENVEIFPNLLLVLEFEITCHHVINCLPKNLVSLNLGVYFDHPIKPENFPNSLQSLTINSNYPHSLKDLHSLPNLTELIFSDILGESKREGEHLIVLQNMIPKSVRKLSFLSPRFDQNLIDENAVSILPTDLTELTVSYSYKKKIQKRCDNIYLPQSLQKITYDASTIAFNDDYVNDGSGSGSDIKNSYSKFHSHFIAQQISDDYCHKWFPREIAHEHGFSFVWQRKL